MVVLLGLLSGCWVVGYWGFDFVVGFIGGWLFLVEIVVVGVYFLES